MTESASWFGTLSRRQRQQGRASQFRRRKRPRHSRWSSKLFAPGMMRVGRRSRRQIAREKRKASDGGRMNVGRKNTRKSAVGEIHIRRDPRTILLRETSGDGGDTGRDRGLTRSTIALYVLPYWRVYAHSTSTYLLCSGVFAIYLLQLKRLGFGCPLSSGRVFMPTKGGPWAFGFRAHQQV